MVDVETPDGQHLEHHAMRMNPVVVVLAVDERDRVLMMYRHRFVTDEWGYELPGGVTDVDEAVTVSAAREFEEETGYRPVGPIEHLVTFQPMPGITDAPHSVFLSRSFERIGEPTDGVEAALLEWVDLDSLEQLLREQRVLGSASVVGLLHYFAYRR